MARKRPKKTARKASSRSPSRPARPRAGKAKGRPKAQPPAAGGAGELLTMDQAIAALKTTRPTFYRWVRSGKVKGMKVGRQWRFTRQDIEMFLKGQEPQIELRADIGPLYETLRGRLAALGGEDPSGPDDSPVARTVAALIGLGVRMRATDIHLEPYESHAVGRLRVDGLLHEVARFDLRLLPAIVEQIKRLAACDVREKALPQDGRIRLSLTDGGRRRDLDIRVCCVPATTGEAVTARILQRDEVFLSLERIDHAPADRRRLMRALNLPWGLIVISGPTGSGKTTVLYSCLMELVSPERKIMSVEDPVEYLLPGVVQVGIRPAQGLTFPRAIRSVLRSDPNVIMVGEVRNREILELCMQSALTGHLVLTTLHTDDAAQALKRMVDIGPPPFLVADATKLVGAQRLVRALCPDCAAPSEPSAGALAEAERIARAGGLAWDGLPQAFRKPVGCPRCAQTGFRGRTLLAEMLEVTPRIASALRDDAPVDDLRAIAVAEGMTTLAADGVRRAAEGQTTLEEAFRVLHLR